MTDDYTPISPSVSAEIIAETTQAVRQQTDGIGLRVGAKSEFTLVAPLKPGGAELFRERAAKGQHGLGAVCAACSDRSGRDFAARKPIESVRPGSEAFPRADKCRASLTSGRPAVKPNFGNRLAVGGKQTT